MEESARRCLAAYNTNKQRYQLGLYFLGLGLCETDPSRTCRLGLCNAADIVYDE